MDDRLIYLAQLINQTGQIADTKFSYDYFSLPLKIGCTIGDNLKIISKIGIQPSLLLNAKTIIPKFDNNGDLIGEETLDREDNVS